MESQLTPTVLLGFGIPYIPYQKLLCLFLVCTSLTLSGISTLGQEGVSNSVESQLTLTVLLGFGTPYIPYQTVIVPISGVHLSHTFRYFYSWSGEGLKLFGVSAHTDSAIRIWHTLYTLPEVISAYFWCAPLSHLSGISTLGQERVQTLWSLSSH